MGLSAIVPDPLHILALHADWREGEREAFVFRYRMGL